jgi:hypothetical protein
MAPAQYLALGSPHLRPRPDDSRECRAILRNIGPSTSSYYVRPDRPTLPFAVTPPERVRAADDDPAGPVEPADPAYVARIAELRGELDAADPARREAELDALVQAFSTRIAGRGPR